MRQRSEIIHDFEEFRGGDGMEAHAHKRVWIEALLDIRELLDSIDSRLYSIEVEQKDDEGSKVNS